NPPTFAGGQLYQLMVDWVENGVEPGRVEITSPSPTPPSFTQPVYPYPQKAVYIGGDPHVASSYGPGIIGSPAE
ncbi:MAG: tannase/feruloyl esterase family alpha/beta hydrolase, partial [Acidimicrobiales bacterium]